MQKDKCRLNHIRLEALSYDPTPITAVTALTRHAPLWSDVRDVLRRARRPSHVTEEETELVVAALIGLILSCNWQRPSAATGATVQEFSNSQEVNEEGTIVVVMRAVRHKTGRQGPVNLTMSQEDHILLRRYVQRVRPLLDPHNICDDLFLLPGPKPVGDINKHS